VQFNLFVTMLLGGIWHGAGWGFALWGALHGAFLMIHHLWRGTGLRRRLRGSRLWARAAQGLTFLCVAVAWVFFRSPSLGDAGCMLEAMAGGHGVSLSGKLAGKLGFLGGLGVRFDGTDPFPGNGFGLLLMAFALIWLAPATPQLFRDVDPCLEPLPYGTRWRLRWRPHWLWALGAAIVLYVAILNLGNVGGFIYDVF
jgi:hypothetical protein